jgi:carbon monoxide dehydrogenase subunit G
MRVEETFHVDRPRDVVFDYLTDPANLAEWQTTKTHVEQLTDGPPGPGTRILERTNPPIGREFDQITEFTEFDRPNRVHIRIVEGPHPIHGTWTFEDEGNGTRVQFEATGSFGGFLGRLGPISRRALSRQMAIYHRALKNNLETN